MYFQITEGPGPAHSISCANITLEGVEVKITELQGKINERGKFNMIYCIIFVGDLQLAWRST
jgi:hypothetical protein